MKQTKSTQVVSRILTASVKLAGWTLTWVALGLLVAVFGTYLIPVVA